MKKKILILFGGKSGEHDVSLSSAASVFAYLDPKKYTVIPVCISKNGAWLSPSESIQYLKTGDEVKRNLLDDETKAHFDISRSLTSTQPSGQTARDNRTCDVVFPVLHGPYGEDGTVQGFLELLGIPFVGSDTLASALAMDKAMAKKVFRAEGILTPRAWEMTAQNHDDILKEVSIPCVVKPVNLGSSVGITIVKSRDALAKAVKTAFLHDRKGHILIEEFIQGREVTVPILGEAALPVIEIVPKRTGDWFSYDVKYNPDLVDEIVPAHLSKELTERAQETALKAHRALQCRHFSRVDIIIQEKTEDMYVLEVNTIPGLTNASLFPKAAQAAGISFAQLLDRLIEEAMKTHQLPQQEKFIDELNESKKEIAAGKGKILHSLKDLK